MTTGGWSPLRAVTISKKTLMASLSASPRTESDGQAQQTQTHTEAHTAPSH